MQDSRPAPQPQAHLRNHSQSHTHSRSLSQSSGRQHGPSPRSTPSTVTLLTDEAGMGGLPGNGGCAGGQEETQESNKTGTLGILLNALRATTY